MTTSAAATMCDVLIEVSSALFRRSPVDAARSGIGAHREAVRDLERLQVDLYDAVVVAQSEIRARAVWHHEDAAVAGIAIGDLQLLDLLAGLCVQNGERTG